jgi:hypothetical protein
VSSAAREEGGNEVWRSSAARLGLCKIPRAECAHRDKITSDNRSQLVYVR